jgi:hypothetical protein
VFPPRQHSPEPEASDHPHEYSKEPCSCKRKKLFARGRETMRIWSGFAALIAKLLEQIERSGLVAFHRLQIDQVRSRSRLARTVPG